MNAWEWKPPKPLLAKTPLPPLDVQPKPMISTWYPGLASELQHATKLRKKAWKGSSSTSDTNVEPLQQQQEEDEDDDAPSSMKGIARVARAPLYPLSVWPAAAQLAKSMSESMFVGRGFRRRVIRQRAKTPDSPKSARVKENAAAAAKKRSAKPDGVSGKPKRK